MASFGSASGVMAVSPTRTRVARMISRRRSLDVLFLGRDASPAIDARASFRIPASPFVCDSTFQFGARTPCVSVVVASAEVIAGAMAG